MYLEPAINTMDLQRFVDKEPYFQYGTVLYIVFSDGHFQPLSIMTRFRVRFLGLTARELQKRLRPDLVRMIETYKQRVSHTKVYAQFGCVQGVPLETTIQVGTATQFEAKKELVPMKYLVWLDGLHGLAAQLWADDFSTLRANGRPSYAILKKIELKPEEAQLPLKALMAMYPYPEQEPGAC